MHANWIGGEWCAARAGATFTPAAALRRAADPAPPEQAWPRSTELDVRVALEAGRVAWRDVPPRDRRAVVGAALDLLSLRADLDADVPWLSDAPDADAERAFERRLGLVYDLDRANVELEATRRPPAELRTSDERTPNADGGVTCVRVHWSELLAGVLDEVVWLLTAGRTVLLLSDPHAPELATRVALAFEAARLPRGVLALVHDDSGACLEAAAHDARVTTFHVSGPSRFVKSLERRLAARRAPAFGAGIDDAHLLRELGDSIRVVARADDVRAAAGATIRAAFSRNAAFSGQAPGAALRVLCHERVFSRFTAELLGQLAASRDAAEPLALLERSVVDDARGMYELGLDEGATPIFTAADAAGGDAKFLFPVVLTNVEEHMRIARVSRCAPVLRLLRVASDDRARTLAADLARASAVEDLSASGRGKT